MLLFATLRSYAYLIIELIILQVRFHPLYPDILASGSLDHEVRLWDAKTAECIGSRDFCNYLDVPQFKLFIFFTLTYHPNHIKFLTEILADRPIASIAFHAQGEILAVASGHKVRSLECIVIIYLDLLYSDNSVRPLI